MIILVLTGMVTLAGALWSVGGLIGKVVGIILAFIALLFLMQNLLSF